LGLLGLGFLGIVWDYLGWDCLGLLGIAWDYLGWDCLGLLGLGFLGIAWAGISWDCLGWDCLGWDTFKKPNPMGFWAGMGWVGILGWEKMPSLLMDQ
jgi:hypothetical protein